jgi:hypothetical protein
MSIAGIMPLIAHWWWEHAETADLQEYPYSYIVLAAVANDIRCESLPRTGLAARAQGVLRV